MSTDLGVTPLFLTLSGYLAQFVYGRKNEELILVYGPEDLCPVLLARYYCGACINVVCAEPGYESELWSRAGNVCAY